MKVELPKSITHPESRQPVNRAILLAIALSVAVFTGWQVFNLPGGLIRRNIAPPDLYGKAWGLRELWIDEDGNWTIKREGFADRRELYKITAAGHLWREDEAPLVYEPMDHSGIAHGSPKNMVDGFMLDVKPSPAYWDIVRGVRRAEDEPRSQVLAADTRQTLPEVAKPDDFEPEDTVDDSAGPPIPLLSDIDDKPGIGDIAELAGEETGDAPDPPEPEPEPENYVPLQIYHIRDPGQMVKILPGNNYYPSMDSWAYTYPDLWLTTNNQQWLHHVPVSVAEGEVVFGDAVSTELALEGRLPTDCVVGVDPVRDSVFILRADGFLRRFDPQTLAPAGSEQLPGYWEREFATVNAGNTEFVFDSGWAMTRPAYERLMRVLMVLFLLSLLAAATIGRKVWKSTSAATTADTTSSEPSSTT